MNERACTIVARARPVGMCVAIEAARRGIDATMLEAKSAGLIDRLCGHVPGSRNEPKYELVKELA